MTLTVGSLFAGIGGIDLGLQRAGMEIKWHSEIEPFACQVLKKHWPDVPNLGDIKKIDWKEVPYVDVIAGGYPCQPFSTAGKRKGENDPRHLWPYFRDGISGIRPRYAILENVRGHFSMGFSRVLGDLAEIGYDAEWQIISAASLGAPHRRDRLICVAYTDDSRNRTPEREMEITGSQISASQRQGRGGSFNGISGRGSEMADTPSERRQKSLREDTRVFSGDNARGGGCNERSLDLWWKIEPDVGRVADGVSNRLERLKGLGNAVVPQLAEYVGTLIRSDANDY